MPMSAIPNLKFKPKVYIAPQGAAHGEYAAMFMYAGYGRADKLADADLVCFTGGCDVNPALYKQKPIELTHWNAHRDKIDEAIYDRAVDLGLPKVGICRGAQFLNVKAGGSMWQDVDNHRSVHYAYIETGAWEGMPIEVTSTHHQMMRLRDESRKDKEQRVLMVAYEAWNYQDDTGKYKAPDPEQDKPLLPFDIDIEAVYYADKLSMCFQPHPEFKNAPDECRIVFFDFLQDCFDLPVHPRVW